MVQMAETTLLADIGGTNSRFAILLDGIIHPLPAVPTRGHPTLEAAMAAALADYAGPAPARALLAVAGPVEGGRMRLTNAPWEVDANHLGSAFGLSSVRLVNDFAAVAWSMPALEADDLLPLGGGQADEADPVVAVGPGTGLGVAAYLPGLPPRVVPGEAGHATLAAADAGEEAVIGLLRARFGHVSAERTLSGPGLVNLYRAIAARDGAAVPDLSPVEVTERALDASCATARMALDMFCAMLGGFAGNLALTFWSGGGVRIAGGIAPKIAPFLGSSRFHARFVDKGRFEGWLRTVPVAIIVHPAAALVGLARLAASAEPGQSRASTSSP